MAPFREVTPLKPDRNDNDSRKSGGIINLKEKRPPTEDPALAVKIAGSFEGGDVRVFLPMEVFEELERRVLRARESELSGILLGDLYRSPAFDYLEVEGFLPLRDTGARFTPETWEALYAELDRRKSDTNIIGWFFSDPSGNLALEGYRQFVHESFFDDPYQVAMGIDPSSGRYRFFQWKEGELTPMPGHYMFGPVARMEELKRLAARPPAEVRTASQGPGPRVQSQRRGSQGGLFLYVVIFLVVALAMGNLLWTVTLLERVDRFSEKVDAQASAHQALAKDVQLVELATRSVSGRLMERPGGVSRTQLSDLERRLAELSKSYVRLKTQLDRSTGAREGSRDSDKKPPATAAAASGKPGAKPSTTPDKPATKPAAATPAKPATAASGKPSSGTPAKAPAAPGARPPPPAAEQPAIEQPGGEPALPPSIEAPAEPEEAPMGPPRPEDDGMPPAELPPWSEPPPGEEPAPDQALEGAEPDTDSSAFETPLTAP
jgi:TolA-binding protein